MEWGVLNQCQTCHVVLKTLMGDLYRGIATRGFCPSIRIEYYKFKFDVSRIGIISNLI